MKEYMFSEPVNRQLLAVTYWSRALVLMQLGIFRIRRSADLCRVKFAPNISRAITRKNNV
jgi:hypothetical protein